MDAIYTRASSLQNYFNRNCGLTKTKPHNQTCRIIFNWKTSARWSDGWFHIRSVACCVVSGAILHYPGTTCETMATGTKLNLTKLATGVE